MSYVYTYVFIHIGIELRREKWNERKERKKKERKEIYCTVKSRNKSTHYTCYAFQWIFLFFSVSPFKLTRSENLSPKICYLIDEQSLTLLKRAIIFCLSSLFSSLLCYGHNDSNCQWKTQTTIRIFISMLLFVLHWTKCCAQAHAHTHFALGCCVSVCEIRKLPIMYTVPLAKRFARFFGFFVRFFFVRSAVKVVFILLCVHFSYNVESSVLSHP